jgi:hypothetical protein
MGNLSLSVRMNFEKKTMNQGFKIWIVIQFEFFGFCWKLSDFLQLEVQSFTTWDTEIYKF